jgi:hypothetical protein
MASLLERMMKVGTVKTSSVLSESAFFNAKDTVETELPILNIAFSGSLNGGMVSGLTILAGLSKSFKTLLALYCMKAYFNKYPDAIALLYDSEFGVTPDYLKANGIDPQRVLHIPIEHVEQLKFDIVKRLEEIKRGDKIFIMVDSLGNLASKKEVEDAENEKSVADMSRAKAIRSLLRIITPHLTMKDLPCIVINHVYNEISGGPYVKTVIPGGCLVEGTKIRMFDGTHKPVEQIAVGEIVETLEGPKYVIDTFTPETLGEGIPECYEVEFEDGHKVVCSRTHPFLTTNGWVPAEALKADAEIVSI